MALNYKHLQCVLFCISVSTLLKFYKSLPAWLTCRHPTVLRQ